MDGMGTSGAGLVFIYQNGNEVTTTCILCVTRPWIIKALNYVSSNLDTRRLTELEVYTNVLFRYTHRPNIG